VLCHLRHSSSPYVYFITKFLFKTRGILVYGWYVRLIKEYRFQRGWNRIWVLGHSHIQRSWSRCIKGTKNKRECVSHSISVGITEHPRLGNLWKKVYCAHVAEEGKYRIGSWPHLVSISSCIITWQEGRKACVYRREHTITYSLLPGWLTLVRTALIPSQGQSSCDRNTYLFRDRVSLLGGPPISNPPASASRVQGL
jgi:hypothetical protein